MTKASSSAVATRDESSSAIAETILKGTQATPETMKALTAMSESISALATAKMTDFVGMMALAKTASDMKKALCTAELRDLVLSMQNNPLFFRADAQYPQDTVATCIVQGYSLGLPPVGNLWNIIGQRFYVTREGVEYKLSSMGVSWSVTCGAFEDGVVIPGYTDRNNKPHSEIVYKAVPVTVDYLFNGVADTFKTVKQVKTANGWTVENVHGKATRKALYDLWRMLASREGFAVPGIQEDDPEDQPAPKKTVVIEAEEVKKPEAPKPKTTAEILQEMLDDADVRGISGESFAEYIYKTRGALPSEEKHYIAIQEHLADYVDGFRAYCNERVKQTKEGK